MPTISMFYGIIVRMYNNGEHNPPHFHATYQGYNAVFNMDGELTDGEMPKKQLKLGQNCTKTSFWLTGNLQ